jgi:hypothetical protein
MIEYTVRVFDNFTEWWLNGKLHREDGPAVEKKSGTKAWYINGNLHREDGPAVIDETGNKYWYRNGNLHREGEPAVEYADGYKSWYLDGVYYTEEQFLAKTKKTCEGKIVEIDGVKYQLTLVSDGK